LIPKYDIPINGIKEKDEHGEGDGGKSIERGRLLLPPFVGHGRTSCGFSPSLTNGQGVVAQEKDDGVFNDGQGHEGHAQPQPNVQGRQGAKGRETIVSDVGDVDEHQEYGDKQRHPSRYLIIYVLTIYCIFYFLLIALELFLESMLHQYLSYRPYIIFLC